MKERDCERDKIHTENARNPRNIGNQSKIAETKSWKKNKIVNKKDFPIWIGFIGQNILHKNIRPKTEKKIDKNSITKTKQKHKLNLSFKFK